jgi:hypothetical protein
MVPKSVPCPKADRAAKRKTIANESNRTAALDRMRTSPVGRLREDLSRDGSEHNRKNRKKVSKHRKTIFPFRK